jgi:hypothetical protein
MDPPSSLPLIDILCDLQAGRITCDDADARLCESPGIPFPKSERVMSFLEHYFADEDIRRRNSDYAAMQNSELGKLISRLQQADYEGAAEITFLHES